VDPANHRQSWRKFNDFRLPAVKEMKKAGVMAQARKEPRFAEIELLTPARTAGASARLAVIDCEVSDVDFETVPRPFSGPATADEGQVPFQKTISGLGLLRQGMPSNAGSFVSNDQMSPGFLAFAAMLAFAVFWLCGGHSLLY
jgi:hypothetical protein